MRNSPARDVGALALASPVLDLLEVDTSSDLSVAVVADLVVAGLYIPAGAGPEPIAGDFYDVLTLGPDRIGLLVGDVAGHGRQALAAMQRLRTAARATIVQGAGPAAALAGLDLLLEGLGQEEFATLWCGEYQPSTGVLTYAGAGHPPPALHAHGGVAVLAEADAPALGTGMTHAAARQHTRELPPGAILVAYSDGLIERRGRDYDGQLELLRAVVTRACDPANAGHPETIAAEILSALIPDPGRAEDDVCLLVVRRAP